MGSNLIRCWVFIASEICLTATAMAQSFDCGMAKSTAELLICSDLKLSELDKRLGEVYRTAMSSVVDPHALKVDQQRWLRQRDICFKSYYESDYDPKCEYSGVSLYKIYEDRIDELKEEADPAKAVACRALLARYRPLAAAHPGEFPLSALAQAGSPDFELGGGGQITVIDTPLALGSWGKQQQPAISISSQLSKSVAWFPYPVTLQKAPGLPFFELNSTQGSMACVVSTFFIVKDGIALLSRDPFNDANNDCPKGGRFASLDSMPLYVRENYDYTPGMKASLDVATWHGDHFEAACTISLSYLPYVSTSTLNIDANRCEGADCDAMRKAALNLVKAKVTGTLSEDMLLQGLTAQQRARYQAEEAAARSKPDIGADYDEVLVPYVRRGDVYVARIADLSIGWRVYADQRVKFEQMEKGALVARAIFSVGVSKGEVEKATVAPF